MNFRKCLFFAAILFFPATLFALPADSLPDVKHIKTNLNYFFEKDFYRGANEVFTIDTSVEKIHHVIPALDLHYNYLSTIGSASEPMKFSYPGYPSSYCGVRSYDLQMLTSEDIRCYRTNKRFTELQYHTGGFKEQQITVLHTQNITHDWNAGLIFDREGEKDFMNFSNTFRSRFALFTNYNSPGKKYNLFAHAIWNYMKNGVNGGLANDSLFDNTSVTNLGIKGLAYKISNAEEHVRKKIFYLSQYYDFQRTRKDSSGKVTDYRPSIRINHRFSFQRNSYTYSDSNPDSSYYSDFFYGTETYDSLHTDEYTNRVSVQIPADTNRRISFFKMWSTSFFAEHQHTNYGQKQDSSWNNLSIGGSLNLSPDSASPGFTVDGIYYLSGFDKGNYLVNMVAGFSMYNLGQLNLNFSSGQSSPDITYRWYDGNNFIWKNSFSPIKSDNISLSYELKKFNFSLEAGQTRIENYVFLNTEARPVQYHATLSTNYLQLNKKFRFRFWHFDNMFILQQTNREGVIHIPALISDQSLFLEKYYFRNAMLAAIGLSLNYNSAYYSNAFMPANALFYIQNEKKTGGYLRFDLFINAQIKTARIFLKMENVADDLIKKSYYLVPHYPMPGRILKFGIIWRFFD